MKIKLTAFIMALILSCAVLLSCAASETGSENTSENTLDVSAATSEGSGSVVLINEENSDYSIIRGSFAGDFEIEAAKNLNMKFKEIFGKKWDMKISDDFMIGIHKDDIVENDDREILIGYTNRIESRNVHETLGEDEYVIRFENGKLVIIGKDEYATLAAVNQFISEYLDPAADSSRFEIDASVNIIGKSEKRKIPLADGASLRILSWNLGCDVGVAGDCVEIILKYLPDIVSLQECNANTHSKVIGKLIDNFDGYAYAKKFHANNSTVIYTPIIYNTKLLTLVDAGVEWLDSRYTGTNTKSLAWAVFDDQNGVRFALIDFHGAVCSDSYKGYENMTSAQRNEIAANWRLDNVRQVLDVKKRLTAAYGEITVMVNGDCNFNEDSQPYANLIAAGFSDSEKTAGKVIKTGYKTSYGYGSVPGTGKSIDHIFGINGPEFVAFDIIREDKVFTGSDHCPIYADFTLKK